MNAKKNKFKLIRFIFYLMGFPALCLATLYLLKPTFNEAAMQNYGKICAMVPFVLWAVVEILRIILHKLAKKGTMHADYATLILVVLTVSLIAVPMIAADYSLYNKYEAVRKEASTKEDPVTIEYTNPLTGEKETTEEVLYHGVWLRDYKQMLGWAIDNTSKGSSWYHGYLSDCRGYISANGLAGFGGSQKGNSAAKTVYYDANLDGVVPEEGEMIVVGKIRGLFEDLEFKEKGKRTYKILATKLEKQLAILQNEQKRLMAEVATTNNILNTALAADTDKMKELLPELKDQETIDFTSIKNTYTPKLAEQKQALKEFNNNNQAKMQELGGQRVRVYDFVIKNVLDILTKSNAVLPDGLDIVALGLTLPVGELVGFIGDILKLAGGININDGTAVDAIIGAVCTEQDENGKYLEIATGIPADNRYDLCAPAARKKADENYTYEGVRELQYKMSIYPQVFAFARLRRVMYMWIGLIIISLLLVDHYTRKIKQIEYIQFNEAVIKDIDKKGYILKTETAEVENDTKVDNNSNQVVDVKLDNNDVKTNGDLDTKADVDKPNVDKPNVDKPNINKPDGEENKQTSTSFQDSIINGVRNHSQGGNN